MPFSPYSTHGYTANGAPTQVITDFFDEMKSRTKGYASMEYSQIGYGKACLVKLQLFLFLKFDDRPIERDGAR